MSEKLTAKQAAEQLLYKPEYAADKSADVKEKAAAFAEGYKAFLNAAKTEREAAAASEKLLLEAGYEKFEPKKTYAPGQKIYFVQEHKAVVAATIGRKSFEEGFRLVIRPHPTAPVWTCARTRCTKQTTSATSRPTITAASASTSGAPCRWPSTACSPVPMAPACPLQWVRRE